MIWNYVESSVAPFVLALICLPFMTYRRHVVTLKLESWHWLFSASRPSFRGYWLYSFSDEHICWNFLDFFRGLCDFVFQFRDIFHHWYFMKGITKNSYWNKRVIWSMNWQSKIILNSLIYNGLIILLIKIKRKYHNRSVSYTVRKYRQITYASW